MASYNERMEELPRIWKYAPDKGIHLRVYRNGDDTFPGKLVTLNKRQFRTFESWLAELSNSMHLRTGAIWRVYTPTTGTRKDDFDDFEEGQSLVVAGQEKFKPLRYDKISSSERKKAPPFNYSVDPVYHTRTFLSSGKIKKIDTHSLLIKVWPNGGDLKGPRRVLVTPRIRPFTLSTVISHVNEMLKEDCMGTVEKLYFLTGTQVSDVEQIIQNGQYVACRKGDKFKRARYNEQAVKNIATSPRLDRKLLAPLFPRSVNSTSQSSPEHSSSSTQNSHSSYPHRRKAADGDEERMFPSKPVKYTRGSDRGRTNGFDKDHGGGSKVKDNNRNSRAARETADGRYTNRDLSVDQFDGQDADDELIPSKGAKKSGTKIQDNSRGHVMRQDTNPTAAHKSERRGRGQSTDPDKKLQEERAAVKIQAGYRGYETRKQQSSLPKRTDQNYNVGARNTNTERYQDPGQKKSIINNGKGRILEKPPASNHQIRNLNKPRYDVTEEEAAIKIQSCFRGYQDRKNIAASPTKTTRDGRNRLASKDQATGLTKAKGSTQKSRQQAPAREDSYDELDLENNAALTIQSHYRGYRTRKNLANRSASSRSNGNYWP